MTNTTLSHSTLAACLKCLQMSNYVRHVQSQSQGEFTVAMIPLLFSAANRINELLASSCIIYIYLNTLVHRAKNNILWYETKLYFNDNNLSE